MAASTTAPGVVDPTKPAKYPVILSDELLGRSPKEILTAIRYNHKPTLSDDLAPAEAKVKPSSSSPGSYDMSYTDEGGKYAYNGTRTTKDNQYVLIFDPERKAFVLHRLDSTLNMNLTRTPSNTDPDALKEEFPHLESSASIRVSTDRKKPNGPKGKPRTVKNAGMVETKRSAAPAKPKVEPAAAKKEDKPKVRARSPGDDEDEDDDSDDDGLLVEYPDPQPPAHSSYTRGTEAAVTPSDLGVRRFSTFAANTEESDEDADAEYEDDLGADEAADSSAGDGWKLPSPVGKNGTQHLQDEDADADADLEPDDYDLEAALTRELEGEMDAGHDSESSVSEED